MSRIVTDLISIRVAGRPAALAGDGRDLLHDLEALDDAAEDRVLAVERRLIADADEELRAGAVALSRLQHGRHGAGRVLLAVWLEPELVQAAVPYCACLAGSFESGSPPWMMP